ncbi:MAG: hypothetical protein K2J67_11540 [Lachnospiraceae bacterium]|nr:hypothetical protein [Lachnospiraceae bacterium]
MGQYHGKYFWVLLIGIFFCLTGRTVSAAEYGDVVQWKEQSIAIYNEDEEMMYQPIGDDGTKETQALNYLLGNDREKTLMIPEGTTIRLKQGITMGSNTTLIAVGVTFIQTGEKEGFLSNQVTDPDYRSLENVVIQGGVWKSRHKKKFCPLITFMQASNIQMEDVTVITSMPETGIRLIACKNVTMTHCEVRCKKNNKRKKKEDLAAIELDPAVPLLTDGIKSVINESCMNGQVCQNILLEKCIVHGRRGIYAAQVKQKKYRDLLHTRIRIRECTVTGTNVEAILLENTIGFSLRKNLLITQAERKQGIHASGILVQLLAARGKTRRLANVVSGNVVYSARYGMVIRSQSKLRFGQTKVNRNRSYVQITGKGAMRIKHCRKKVVKNNKIYV